MARLSRHEMKTHEFQTTVEEFEHFARENYQTIIVVTMAILAVAAATLGYRWYSQKQEAEANIALGTALATFHATVGPPANGLNPNQPPPDPNTFATASDKYKKALGQFLDVVQKYPRQEAAAIARYHAGLCQAELGDEANAMKSLQEAAKTSNKEIASLAQLALAAELVKGGKVADAAKIYRDLAGHPTTTVPRATALLAEADAYRATQPAQARAIYQQMAKEFSTDRYLISTVQQQMASLPQ